MKTPRRKFTYPWFLVSLLLLACFASLLLVVQTPVKTRDALLVTTATAASAPVVTSSSAFKRVTKSLSELRQSVTVPELSGHVLFFNRVPKSGSEMLVLLLQWLQGMNGFRHVRLGGGDVRKLNRIQQEELVEEVTQRVRDEAVPVSFDRHVYFLNFSHFDKQSPTYINLVRDPIDKAASRFYYARATPDPHNPDIKGAPKVTQKHFNSKDFEECVNTEDPECVYRTGHSYDLTIPYFCGHHDYCIRATRLKLEKILDTEYEFYYWLRARLLRQHAEISPH
ncbi:hypothetical protein C0J52_24161 [Blattella germanica]|nr:hypothetical protein C0J52_24161 [Blattella germanica]